MFSPFRLYDKMFVAGALRAPATDPLVLGQY